MPRSMSHLFNVQLCIPVAALSMSSSNIMYQRGEISFTSLYAVLVESKDKICAVCSTPPASAYIYELSVSLSLAGDFSPFGDMAYSTVALLSSISPATRVSPFVGDIPEVVTVVGLENSTFGAVLSTFALREIGNLLPAVSVATMSSCMVPLPVVHGIASNVYSVHLSAVVEPEVTLI